MKDRVFLGTAVVGLLVLSANGLAAIAQTPPLIQEQGVLEEGDSILQSDGSLYDQYTFEGEEGQSITISMESDEFDTYLALIDPEQKVIAENDDVSQDDQNSAFTVTLPSNGTYVVIANGFDSNSRGQYSIEANVNDPDNAP